MEYSREDVEKAIRRLGRDRLVDECETRIGVPPKGDRWRAMSVAKLAALIADNVGDDALEQLAAEGLAKQRAPSVGGPFWTHEIEPALSAERAEQVLPRLREILSEEWEDVKVQLAAPEMLQGVVYAEYSSFTLQTSGDGLFEALSRNTAMILLDYEDQISTVSARTDRDALRIGAAWAGILGSDLSPVELQLTPSLDHDVISASTVQMLEAVYGRINSACSVVNVDRIWTKRRDPGSQVQEQWARGQDKHVLLDEDVHRSLRRGDDVTGLAFQVNWTYKGRKEEQHYVAHVTISAHHGPLILRVTRSGNPFERASALYQLIRRQLAQPTSEQGKKEVERVIHDEIFGDS